MRRALVAVILAGLLVAVAGSRAHAAQHCDAYRDGHCMVDSGIRVRGTHQHQTCGDGHPCSPNTAPPTLDERLVVAELPFTGPNRWPMTLGLLVLGGGVVLIAWTRYRGRHMRRAGRR